MFSYNFAFLESINKKIYTEFCDYEKYMYTDPYKASDGVRHVLGKIVDEVAAEERNKTVLNEQLMLWKEDNANKKGIDRVKELKDVHELIDKFAIIKNANTYVKRNNSRRMVPGILFQSISGMGVPDINPNIDNANYWKNTDAVNVLRSFGNNGPHPEATNIPILPTVNNAIIAYKVLHAFFVDYYKSRLGAYDKSNLQFDEKKIPIGDYFIDAEYIPIDAEWSKCIKEYGCHFYEGNNDLIKHYAILREYKEEDYSNDNLFVTRNIDIYGNIKSVSATNNVSVNEIRCISQDGNGSYFIAYEFARTPYRLNNETFKRFSFSIKDRMEICSKLINDIYKLHFANPPIYHRDLSFDSIALCNFSENESEWVPYIIKFNFAKYKDGQVGTVVENLIAADYRMYEDEKAPARLNKYRIDVIDKDTEWDKVDIYSLGNLLVDILLLNIHAKKIGQKNFEDIAEMLFIKPDSPTITMLKRMLSEDIYERPDIGEVKAVFDKEAERWI